MDIDVELRSFNCIAAEDCGLCARNTADELQLRGEDTFDRNAQFNQKNANPNLTTDVRHTLGSEVSVNP